MNKSQAKAEELARLGDAPPLFGIDHFSQNLSVVLAQKIKETLSDLEKEIKKKSETAVEELARLGDAPPSDKESRLAIIKDLLKAVTDDIRNSAQKGDYTTGCLSKEPRSRIYANFRTLANICQNEIMQGMPQWDVADIQRHMAEKRGMGLPGFLSFNIFSTYVQEMVEGWKKPVTELLDSTTELIIQSCHIIVGHHAQNSEAIKYDLEKSVDDVVAVKRKGAKTTDRLNELFESEMNPNTVNPLFEEMQNMEKSIQFTDFLINAFPNFCGEPNQPDLEATRNSIIKAFGETFKLGSESNDKKEAELLKKALEAYWKTKAAAFVDKAVDTINWLLLKDLHDEIEKEFYSRASEDDFSHYFCESPHVEMKRRDLQTSIDRLVVATESFKRMSFEH